MIHEDGTPVLLMDLYKESLTNFMKTVEYMDDELQLDFCLQFFEMLV